MKRILSWALFSCLSVLLANAYKITPDMALDNVEEFVVSLDDVTFFNPRVESLFTVTSSTDSSVPVLYVYNVYSRLKPAGKYVIAAGVSGVRKVLAYGDTPLDTTNIPEAMQALIDWYQEQIDAMIADGDDEAVAVRERPGNTSTSVPPLITAMWGQGVPYNLKCPTYNGTKHYSTGCASTALSMIFHYYQYSNLVDSVSAYVTNTLHIDRPTLPPIDFDWGNMIDEYRSGEYTDEQADAVATLMQYVGQSEKMDYTSSGSGAFTPNVYETLKRFGYSGDYILKLNYDDQAWSDIMLEDLQDSIPIFYCATAKETGNCHAFVVDGYDAVKDMFHINWGWDGDGNGYCTLNEFKKVPDGTSTYCEGQGMIYNIHPADKTITVDKELLEFEEYTGYTQTKTFTVSGLNLSENVQLTFKENSKGQFAVSPTVITPAEAVAGKEVTVFFIPNSYGEDSTAIMLSSNEIETVEVNLYGFGWRSVGYIIPEQTEYWLTDTIPYYDPDDPTPHLKPYRSFNINFTWIKATTGDPVMIGYSVGGPSLMFDPDVHDFEPEQGDYNFDLVGDDPYFVGSVKSNVVDVISGSDTIRHSVGVWYRFNTMGEHEAILTISHKTLTAKPVVIYLHGEGVLSEDAPFIYGDLNFDGSVDVGDVTALINYVLGKENSINVAAADLNNDGKIDVADVTMLIQYVLSDH